MEFTVRVLVHDYLFTPLTVGAVAVPNRVFLAPLTRMRATQPGDVPNDLMREYYVQRASAGLLISEGRRNVLSGERVLVGRSRECDVVVSDPNVSRRHIELRRGEHGWTAIDLGSTNGMKINGRRVSQAQLGPGDRITIGVTDLTFELD